MKKAISAKNKARKESRNKQDLEVDAEAVKALRTVGDNEVFYFYEAIGKPTGEVARNLSDFLDKVKSTKSESLAFHLQRGDFENWIANTLGDSNLANKLASISSSSRSDIRTSIYKIVENHIKELTGLRIVNMVQENVAVLLPSP